MQHEQLDLFDDASVEEVHPATAIEDVVNETRLHVQRLRPPVKAHGGKYYLASKIVPVLLSAPGDVTEYCEPCAFGGSVFLAMPQFEREILGDINPDVVDLWRTLSRERLAGLLSVELSLLTYDEATFAKSQTERPRPITDETLVEKVADIVVRSRFSRGGLGKTFAWSDRTRGGQPGDVNSWRTFRRETLPKIIRRTLGVEVVEQNCWQTVWESRERIQRLVYADPPYMPETRTAKTAYGPHEMTPLQHAKLVVALRRHAGPAAISGYRCPEYDRWLSDWRRLDFDMPNHSGQGKKKQRRCESLWINW